MSDMCRHQREKLLGIPQTGACATCCPWMFPNKPVVIDRPADVVVTDEEVASWRSKARRSSSPNYHRDPQAIRDNITLCKRIGTYREWKREDCWP